MKLNEMMEQLVSTKKSAEAFAAQEQQPKQANPEVRICGPDDKSTMEIEVIEFDPFLGERPAVVYIFGKDVVRDKGELEAMTSEELAKAINGCFKECARAVGNDEDFTGEMYVWDLVTVLRNRLEDIRFHKKAMNEYLAVQAMCKANYCLIYQ